MGRGRDPIFGRPRRRTAPVVLLVLVAGIVAAGAWLWYGRDGGGPEVIAANQRVALGNAGRIMAALQRWKRDDYDANGRPDYPLDALRRLVETRLIDERQVRLIPGDLAEADLRESGPSPVQGYLFTLNHPAHPWPGTAMTGDIWVLAIPRRIGVTGACTFYLHSGGERYYSQLAFTDTVPPCPDATTIADGTWIALEPAGAAPRAAAP